MKRSLSEVEIGEMRIDYRRSQMRRADLRADPFDQFTLWFEQAIESRLAEANAMSLATVGLDGRPSLRTVLLKSFDSRGFVFFTNLESKKARHITENPNVSVLFPWLALERQVIVGGAAERISTAESLKYFLTRPLESRLAAWASPQSQPIRSRQLLEMKLAEMKRKFSNGEVPLPSFWGGYRVKPCTIEFWQGGGNRLHDRFQYTRQPDDTWTIERLAP